jgi:hypothetical protein
MRTVKNFLIGFIYTMLILNAVILILAVVAAAAFGIEMLAQHWHVYGDPADYFYDDGNEGTVFGVTFVILLMGIIGAACYAYDKGGE